MLALAGAMGGASDMAGIPEVGVIGDATITEGAQKAALEEWVAACKEALGMGYQRHVTISGDALDATPDGVYRALFVLSPQAGSTDTLNAVSSSSFVIANQRLAWLMVSPAAPADTQITVVDSGGANRIELRGPSLVLTRDPRSWLLCRWISGGLTEVARGEVVPRAVYAITATEDWTPPAGVRSIKVRSIGGGGGGGGASHNGAVPNGGNPGSYGGDGGRNIIQRLSDGVTLFTGGLTGGGIGGNPAGTYYPHESSLEYMTMPMPPIGPTGGVGATTEPGVHYSYGRGGRGGKGGSGAAGQIGAGAGYGGKPGSYIEFVLSVDYGVSYRFTCGAGGAGGAGGTLYNTGSAGSAGNGGAFILEW